MPHQSIANCQLKASRSERLGNSHFAFSGTARSVVVHFATLAVALWWAMSSSAVAQDMAMPGTESLGVDNGAAPMMQSGGGSYFSQDLGTILRLRYNTESYGQNGHGNFDVGTMQVFSFDDSIAFFDGQVTMNEVQGVGFNLGLGHRWMHFPSYAATGRVDGLSIWADGTSTDEGGFFPQIGLSAESLGDMWDFRANGYIPVGQDTQLGDFEGTGATGFFGNSIGELTQAVLNSSFYAAELETARRLGSERDAWAFAGPYFLYNDEDDSAGIRAGLRGYAYPDLMLQIGVSHDEIFDTNASFSIVWFVGRTRTDFQPACGVEDRFREPVLRNDYVVLSQSFIAGGDAFTQPDGTALRIVHIDSTAGAGGDGTFENPFDNLPDVNGAGSLEGDIILAHAESVFTGEASTVLKDNQRLLGEGDGFEPTIVTAEAGTIVIPETAPGARDAARPQLVGPAPGLDAIVLADANEVANFDIDGNSVTARAIASQAAGSGNPNLHDLAVSNTTGDAIALTPLEVVDTDDVDNDNNTTETFVRGNVTINQVTFDNVGGDDIDIDAATDVDVTDPMVTLQETILISDVTSTNGNGAGVRLANTHDGRTATILNYSNGTVGVAGSGGGGGQGVLRFEGTAPDDFAGDLIINNADIRNSTGFAFDFLNVASTTAVTLGTGSSWDGGTDAGGGFRANNFNGTVTASNTTLEGGTLGGIALLGDSDGTFTFQATVTLTDIGGTDFLVDGGAGNLFTGTASLASDIDNSDGNSVIIRGISDDASVTINGDIIDTAQGIIVESNNGGLILFAGNLDLDTTTFDAIRLTDNDDTDPTDIDFTGMLDINTTTGTGFEATGGGNLTVSANNNTLTTTTGQILVITGMNIDGLGANFFEVNRTAAGAATNAIQLEDNTGGPITIGNVAATTAGDNGTIEGGTADAILIKNSANVTVSALEINNNSAVAGVRVEKTTTGGQTVNLNDLRIDEGANGIVVVGGGGPPVGGLDMTINDTDINDSTVVGLSINNVDTGPIDVINTRIDGNPANAGAVGVLITGSDAAITFDSNTLIQNWADNDFEVTGDIGTISFAGDIVNASSVNALDTTGRSVDIHGVTGTGGTVTFTATSSINDDNEGMLIDANSAGTFTFVGDASAAFAYRFNTGAATAVTMTGNTGATINIGDLDIDTTSGQGFVATGGGTLSVTGTSNTITRTAGLSTGSALNIENMTIGAVDFESVNATDGDSGIRLVNNTDGTITVGDTGNAVNQGGTITGTEDAGVHVTNSDVVLNGVTVQNAGDAVGENAVDIVHDNAATMDVNLNRLTVTNATAARDGIEINGTGGTGAFNANIQNLDVDVTGNGLDVHNDVTLTAGGTNTIDTVTGVGLRLADITASAASANFTRVTVTAGTTNGIFMQDVAATGAGQVQVGAVGGAANSGGALTTTGDAIVLENVANVDLRQVQVVSAGGAAANIDHTAGATTAMDVTFVQFNLDDTTGTGIDVLGDNDGNAFNFKLIGNSAVAQSDLENDVVIDIRGAGAFGMLVDDTTINITGAGDAFSLMARDGATDIDATIRDSDFVGDLDQALFIDSFDATFKDFKLLVEDGSFIASGTDPAADIRSRGNTLMQATVQGNMFASAGATNDLDIRSDGTASARMRLNLGGDDPADFNSATGAGNMIVRELGTSDFDIFEVDDTIDPPVGTSRNADPVLADPNKAAFDNLNTAPPLPTIP